MDDLISRQAAIEVAEDAEMKWLKGEIDFIYPKVIKGLMSLPTIEERKTGRWIHDETKDAIEAIFLARPKCSECGFEIAYETHFCPNCGADMRTSE